jgi:hypothetical protein
MKTQIYNGSVIEYDRHALSGRKAMYNNPKVEVEILGLLKGKGANDRNAWVISFPGSVVQLASRRAFRVL